MKNAKARRLLSNTIEVIKLNLATRNSLLSRIRLEKAELSDCERYVTIRTREKHG